MSNLIKRLIISSLLLMTSYKAIASGYHSHVHGLAEINIAMEQDKVDFQLIAPAESLLGFEHRASTAKEISEVEALKTYLSKQPNVIQFNGGKCQVGNVEIDTGDILNNSEHKHSHAEIKANYQLSCDNTNDISSATVLLFQHYKTLEQINVMWLTTTKQGSTKLDENNTGIKFH